MKNFFVFIGVRKKMQPTNWTGDFIADVFTDRLHPTEELSFNDPIPTKCSFGRGKRQEEIPVPRMPKILLFQLKENVPSIGRGLQRKAKSSHATKPGIDPSQSISDQKTDPSILQEKTNPQNSVVKMEPLFLDQNCPLSIPAPIIPSDHSLLQEDNVTEQFGLDMKNETEFPSLPTVADKDCTSKQTKSNTKTKSQKKKNKKKS